MLRSICSFIHSIKMFFLNLFDYFPLLISDRDWDWIYIYIVLRFKLIKVRDYLFKHGDCVGYEVDVFRINYCISLIDRILSGPVYIDYDIFEKEIQDNIKILHLHLTKYIQRWWN